jgi:hypothetical protein
LLFLKREAGVKYTRLFYPAMNCQIVFSTCLLLLGTPSFAADLFFDFNKENLHQTPAGFLSTVSGEGQPGRWQVVEDEVPSTFPSLTPSAPVARKPVLAQLSRDITDEHYPILVYTNDIFGDFTFATRLKCVGGAIEQMAGIVFRYQDAENFYYVRASAKGNTLRFFKVVGGQRGAAIGPEMVIPAGAWHELSVECRGNQIKVHFNGVQAIPTMTDNSLAAGHVGFWTKSDSVSYFADARVNYTPRVPFIKTLLQQMHERYPRVRALKVYARAAGDRAVRIVASTNETEIGQAGGETETDIFYTDTPYFGRLKSGVVVTMPLHDRNGDVIAALRVEMRSFPGQTELNAVARAQPIVADMERQIVEARDLF